MLSWDCKKKLDEAESVLIQYLEIEQLLHGNQANHHEIANTLGNLGIVYRKQRKLGECMTMRRILFREQRNHPIIAQTLYELGKVQKELEKTEIVLSILKESLSIYRQIHAEYSNRREMVKVESEIDRIRNYLDS